MGADTAGPRTAPRIDRDALLRALERAPRLADGLAREAPFPSVDVVIERARALLDDMTLAERIAVLDAHPRIGAHRRTLSELSRREQGGDLGRANDKSGRTERDGTVLRQLADLNAEYERRFGFRFVVFVAGRSRAEIVPVLRARLERSRDEELRAGTDELLAITRDRLSRL